MTSWSSFQSLEPQKSPNCTFFSLKKALCIYYLCIFGFWAVVSLHSCSEKRPSLPCHVHRLLITMAASLLQSTDSTLLPALQLQGLRSCGSQVICYVACRIFPDQGSNTCVPCIAGWTLNCWTPGKPMNYAFRITHLRLQFSKRTDATRIFQINILMFKNKILRHHPYEWKDEEWDKRYLKSLEPVHKSVGETPKCFSQSPCLEYHRFQ